MQSTTFTELLDTNRVIVADGAMGTSLFALGLANGACPELLNVEHPDIVEQAHAGFVGAGLVFAGVSGICAMASLLEAVA